MESERKNVFGTMVTLMVFISSMFASFVVVAPAVSAANGVGEVTYMSIDGFESDITKGVQTVDTTKEHVYRIHNDDTEEIDCIDEIIIEYPSSWQNSIDLNQVSVTNMNAVIKTLETDDGSLSELTPNTKAVKIVPDKSIDGVEICPSGTTEITIGGDLKSPLNPEDSTIKIYTSDMSHNEQSGGQVRQLIAALPVVHVTAAEQLKVQYLDFTSTGVDSGADLRITASARGAWGRLTELYLKGFAGTTIAIYMDDGSGVLDGGDRLIGSGSLLTTTTTFALNNYAGFDIGLNVNEGFVKDVEQGGSPVEYYIDITGGPSVITIEGHADEDGNQAIDPTYDGTGYTNPPKEGTVLNVEVPGRQRLILVQLVREAPTNSSTRLLDVKDDNIPIYFTTTLSSFTPPLNVSPRLTDSSGQVELSLEPGTTTGNALVEVCFPDPECTDEDVAISPGVADSCAITKGLNTEVEAGSIEIIEATVYDQYENPISNNPSPPTVTFEILSSPGPDADLDDDINPPFTGDGDGAESEQSNFGIADVSLQTSATVGDHVVEVKADGMNCGTTTVKGVLGQGGKTSCEVISVDDPLTPLEETEIDADDCFDVLVTVKDKNGNPLPKWESIVEFSLEDTSKTIQSTTLREEKFITPYKVQGKLNPNDPAQALVTVCGCDELGTLDVVCKTDTLKDGTDRLNVINSEPTCIDVGVEDRDNECDYAMKLHTSILDTCGNKVVDQECQEGGFASSCVLLEADDDCAKLSTEKTCVDLANTGQAPLVDLDISECACGDIDITVTDTGDCCDSVYPGALLQCDDVIINKLGPATRIDMEVYPYASNQDDFWVSEKEIIALTLMDDCDQEVTCQEEIVDVELTGEDCVDTEIQVDSPYDAQEIYENEGLDFEIANIGDLLGTVNLPGNGGCSVAGTFDGVYYMTMQGGLDCDGNILQIYTPPVGGNGAATLVASKSIVDAGNNPVSISVVSWDPGRGKLWGAYDNAVYLIDVGDKTQNTAAVATFQFNPNVGGNSLIDGLAYDSSDDTLYLSPDVDLNVYHFSLGTGGNPPLGTLMNTVTPKNAAGQADGLVSGVVVGTQNTLYIGRNGAAQIRRVDKTNGNFVSTFATTSGRVEDLTCDPITYAPKEAILAKDAYNALYEAFEVEPGTCPLQGEPLCVFEDEVVHKVVIENCAKGNKELGNKEWTDLPEKDDIVVDKIAFEYNGPTTGVTVCVYEETEAEAGFQASGSNEDLLWKCSDLSSLPIVPSNDYDTSENAAWDEIHDANGLKDGVGDVYLIELDDRISKYNGMNEYDNQRLGGAIVEPGDTKDFYLVMSSNNGVPCGTYDADYLYFQDYNSPDIIDFSNSQFFKLLPENPPVVDGNEQAGEWLGALQIPVVSGMGTVSMMVDGDYLYVLFDLLDSNDARTSYPGEVGNDQIGLNINPTDGGPWGFPYDLIFETSALSAVDGGHHVLPWNPKVNSGTSSDGWATRWFPNNAQGTLPADLESATVYSGGRRITEWKLPLSSIGVSPGDVLRIGGAVDVGDGKSYVYPSGLVWSDEPTYKTYTVGVGTHVRDTLKDSEEYTRRNDDYTGSDPYPRTTPSTPDYGFGDRILHNLVVGSGQAFVYFRDLVAETVNIFVDADLPVNFIGYPPAVADNQAEVTFLPQPATQVVARNHGDLEGDSFICDDAGYEPTYEYDPDNKDNNHCHGWFCPEDNPIRDCRPAMACSDEGYDVNLQVTDGFQNQVGLETEVQLQSCLTYPHFIYLGDTLLPLEANITIDLWEFMGLHDLSSDPWDVCFDMGKFRLALKEIINDKLGHEDYFATAFLESTEFIDFVNSIFEGKEVKFLDENGAEITQTDAAGKLIVKTDADGKARIRVVSDDSSLAQIKSFDASFRIFTVPHALDADYFDVAFSPGEPAAWDIMAVPENGIPADGEQEAAILIRKLDACGNPVAVDEMAKVTAYSDSGRAIISRDFSGNNNLDNSVEGDLSQWTCKFLFPWFEDCSLQVLNDVIEDVSVVVEDAQCEGTQEGYCTGPQGLGCETFNTKETCPTAEGCIWRSEQVCQESDSTMISFVGAPIKLTITEIKHSDLIPADGWKHLEGEFDLPPDACTDEEIRECELYGNKEICFKDCVSYGNTGAWVTVEVQDKFGQRVTGYLGDGLKGDPGDKYGLADNIFEKICVALDEPDASIDDYTFGWIGLYFEEFTPKGAKIYCGDLAYGKGSFKVTYDMLDIYGQPLDPRETQKVIVSVFDVCDREKYESYGGNWKEKKWDDLCNAQEYNENNLPDSETASRLDPDSNKIIFVSVPDRWDINADKLVVAADGKDYATLTINTENEYMDVRTSLDATVQSSLLGSKLESEAITPGCYVEGIYDPINPTSINVQTEDCSGGRAELRLSSTEPGTARVTVTGNGFGCKEYVTGKEYKDWFEATFGESVTFGFDIVAWKENCTETSTLDCVEQSTLNCETDLDWNGEPVLDTDCVDAATINCRDTAETRCGGLALSFHIFFTEYLEFTLGYSEQENTVLYTPFCEKWGVIPLTPKNIEVEFKQAYNDMIKLKAGWNYFSVPYELDPSGDTWSELGLDAICDASSYFNEGTQLFVSPIPGATKLEPMEGYWCYVDEAENLPVEPLNIGNGAYLPPTKTIVAGWNDVALATHVEKIMEHALITIDSLYKQVYDWVEILQRYISIANTGELGGGSVSGTTGTSNMEAGEAYFIHSSGSGEAGLS